MDNDALLKAVEDELDSHPWRLRFTEGVETRFEADTQRQRSHHMVVAGLIASSIYGLFLINDYSFRPDAFTTALLMRLGGILFFALPVLWCVYRGVVPSAREALMASTVVVATTTSCLIFVASSVPYSYLDVFSFGLLFLVSNIVYSLRFRYAVLTTASCMMVMLAFILPYSAMPSEVKRLAIFTLIATALFTLVANYRFERSERTSYLHVLREKLQAGYYLKDNQKLSRLSVTDSLTNLANRRQFDAVFPMLWQDAANNRLCLGLMILDIDHFKAYNDYYGHPQGDACLRQVSQAMRINSRDADLVGRFGGEEFVVLIVNTSPEAAVTAAERIRYSIGALQIPNRGVSAQSVITVSIGVAVLSPSQGLTLEDLLSQADNALYEAKRHGRNRTWLAGSAEVTTGEDVGGSEGVSAQ